MAILLQSRDYDIGGVKAKRVLPHREKRMVGPFVFMDHFGPTEFAPGQGVNVKPHPHIGLSTLTYLFDGSILHRDSLGNHVEILPGDVNWMTAGRGIVHSERETFEVRANQHSINGLQSWVVLPPHMAEMKPSFTHFKKHELPLWTYESIMMRLIAGEAYGMSSPVKTFSPMFYIDVVGCAGSQIEIPNPEQETAIYTVYGSVRIDRMTVYPNRCVTLEPGERSIEFAEHGRFIMFGGDRFERPPHMRWNFVSYDQARIEKAEKDWREGRFPTIPGDDQEHADS